jgi:glycosyltransferase involved in cell wall biosynthesis
VNDAGQTICLCMIVKDEAPVIARCLESVRPLIDAWALVDTGSADETQAIVRRRLASLPGEMIERPWVDFAHNRTEALELARGRADYILVIDADETLEADAGFRLPTLAADAYDVEVRYDGIGYQRRQLLRDGLDWCYRGVLHEYVDCEQARTVGRIAGLRTIVRHDGARARDPLTYQRDALVLARALLEEPENSRYAFYLAQSYRDAGELEAAIRAYRKRAAMGGWREEVWCSLYQIALIEQRLERAWPEVMQSFLAAYAAAPDRAEPLFRIGVHYQSRGEHQLASLFLERAVAIPTPGAERLFVERDVYDFLLAIEYAVAAHYSGELVAAVETCNALLRSAGLPPEAAAHVIRNRRFSLDALHPKAPAIVGSPPRVHVIVPVSDPGSELEAAVDGALRQDGAACEVAVIHAGSGHALAARLPSDPRLRVLCDTTPAAHVASACAPEDVVVVLQRCAALASRETARAIAAAFADRGCRLLHGAHMAGDARARTLQPAASERAFHEAAGALDDATALCFRASLAHAAGGIDARALWSAAGFAGTRSLDVPLTVDVSAHGKGCGPRAAPAAATHAPAADATTPGVSCLMVTRDRLALARLAMRCFADQTLAQRELVVVCEGARWYRRALRRCAEELELEHFTLVPATAGTPLGALRNLSMDAAAGEIVCQWDDDDLFHPTRLAVQLEGMLADGAQACFLTDHLQYLERDRHAFWIDWTLGGRLTDELQLFPGTVMMYKDGELRYPQDGPFAHRGEDSVLVSQLFHTRRVARLPGMGHVYLYRYHGANTFDEAHHMQIARCCAPGETIRPLAARIREALDYYPIPKPVTVFGAQGPALTVG